MTATPLGTVMDAIGTALATVTHLRVFDFPPKSAQPPFAFVGMPDSIQYDATYVRGYDSFEIPVFVGVGTQVDRNTRDALAAYADGGDIKAAIEAITAFVAIVKSAEFVEVELAGGSYPGVKFNIAVTA